MLTRVSKWGMAAFDLIFAAMPLMCFLCGCLRNRVSTWGMAGFNVLFAAMPLICFLCWCLRNRALTWGMAGFDLLIDAMDVCLAWVLLKPGVYMGNGVATMCFV